MLTNEPLGPYAGMLNANGQLRPECVSDLLVEVIGGKHIFEACSEIYASRPPRTEESDGARTIYVKRRREAIQRGLMTHQELEAFAIDQGIFDPAEREQKAALESMLERNLQARTQSRDESQKVQLDAEIIKLRDQILKLEEPEAAVFCNSAEARAEQARVGFLTFACTLQGDLLEDQVWPTWQAYQSCDNDELVAKSRAAVVSVSSGMPTTIIRALARTGEWRGRWKSAKESSSPVFGGASTTWSTNQTQIVYWADFYDSVRQHPDAPSEVVIEDDEALQSWLNVQLAKKPKVRNQGQTVYQRDGKGNRRAMAKVGTKTNQVNTGYKIRTGNE